MGYFASVNPLNYPNVQLWVQLSEAFAHAAAVGADRLQVALRPRRQGSYCTRRPGRDSPMWNVCATLLRQELTAYGTKVRLARYLGIPKQRLYDYLNGRSRLPDAELTLRMLHWLSEKRQNRDLSL